LSISFILAEAFHAKNYITMWVLLSSRPYPVIYQVGIGKVVEKADSLK